MDDLGFSARFTVTNNSAPRDEVLKLFVDRRIGIAGHHSLDAAPIASSQQNQY